MAITYKAISTINLNSIASFIEFTNIPQTYTDLIIKFAGRLAGNYEPGNAGVHINFNGSSTNFSGKRFEAYNNSLGSDNVSTLIGTIGGGSLVTANTFTNFELYIPNYTSNNNKSISTDFVSEDNDSSPTYDLGFVGTIWNNTAAITSIKIIPSFDLAQNSKATLYGIKNL